MTIRLWHGVHRMVLVAAILAAALCAWFAIAPDAHAEPANVCDLNDLQRLLDANGGTLDGYFKTVIEGSTIVDVPARVRSVVPNMTQDGALILFEARDSVVSDLGGIASGMSGSPLYVQVSGRPDLLVGAVSYGDAFTLGDLGLATPIEYMIAIQSNYLSQRGVASREARSASLATPVSVDGSVVKRVVVATSVAQARAVKVPRGTTVFAPLTTVQIGGLSPKTAAYKAMAERLESMGLSVATGAAASTAGNNPAWSTSLTGGSSMAVLLADGDLWAGAAGTVTYVDDSVLLGFGHPLGWFGETEAYLTNAWVSGIWGSAMSPYKLMAPAKLQGTITQDRWSGVAGRIGVYPVAAPVSSRATVGARSVASSSTMPRSLASDPDFSWIAAEAAAVPVYKALDAYSYRGSARTTVTVVVSDGTEDYTVTRTNIWDDSDDVSWYSTEDVSTILAALTANIDGIAPATIKSIDFTGDYSSARNAARIVSISVPGGLKTGSNDVLIDFAVYGDRELRQEHATLEIPKGTSLHGLLEVYAYGSGGQEEDSYSVESSGEDRQTVAEIVDDLNEMPTNADIIVEYFPESGGEDAVAQTRTTTPWVVSGDVSRVTSTITLKVRPRTVKYGRAVSLSGTIESATGDTTVDLYAKVKGGTKRTFVATVPARTLDGVATFRYRTGKLKKTTRYTAEWAGDDVSLGSVARASVTVRPKSAMLR